MLCYTNDFLPARLLQNMMSPRPPFTVDTPHWPLLEFSQQMQIFIKHGIKRAAPLISSFFLSPFLKQPDSPMQQRKKFPETWCFKENNAAV